MRELLSVSILCIMFCLPGLSLAEEEKKDKKPLATMDEVVVTATRDEEEVRNVPASVDVITEEDIKQSGATSIIDVLKKYESIQFKSWSGNPSQAFIDMRGFGGDNPHGKTLVLLDGRRLNRPDMASINWLQIPINNIERIEIVRGASTVLYGDSAIAGVINIITKKSGAKEINTSVITGSHGLKDGRIAVAGGTDKITYSLTGERQEVKGYRERSEFASNGGGFNVGYDVTDDLNATFGLSYVESEYESPGSLTQNQLEADRKQATNFEDDSANTYFNTDLKVESSISDLGLLELGLQYGKKEIDNNITSWGTFSLVDIDTICITPKMIIEKDFFNKANKLIVGLDYSDETLSQKKYSEKEKINKLSEAEFTRKSVGYYIRDDFNILDNLILCIGYRDEKTEIKGKEIVSGSTIAFDNEKEHTGQSYEAGLTYLFREKDKGFVKYTKVYRYPFLDEQASYYGFAGSDVFLTDLEKEEGDSYEMGVRIFPIATLELGLTVYRIDMKDEISWNGTTFRNENLDKTRHEGIEFATTYEATKTISISGNYTYHNAEFRDGMFQDKKIPLVPESMANMGIEISLPYSFSIRPEMQYISKRFLGTDNDNSSEPLGSYTLYDLFLRYGPHDNKKWLSAFIGVENILGEEYISLGYESGSFFPAPEMTIKGGISFAF